MNIDLIRHLSVSPQAKTLLVSLVNEGNKTLHEYGPIDTYVCLSLNDAFADSGLVFTDAMIGANDLYDTELMYPVDENSALVDISVRNVTKFIKTCIEDSLINDPNHEKSCVIDLKNLLLFWDKVEKETTQNEKI